MALQMAVTAFVVQQTATVGLSRYSTTTLLGRGQYHQCATSLSSFQGKGNNASEAEFTCSNYLSRDMFFWLKKGKNDVFFLFFSQ